MHKVGVLTQCSVSQFNKLHIQGGIWVEEAGLMA